MESTTHPQLATIAAILAARGVAPADPLRQPLTEARATALRFQAVWNETLPPVHRVTDARVDSGGRTVPMRIFLPEARHSPSPVLLYFHGGGFALNGLGTHERLMRLLALRSGVAVVGVGYGLAPEHRFPSQLADAVAALAWVRDAGAGLGLDGGRVAVGGDSAGANLALALQINLRDRRQALPVFGVLLYGMFSADVETPSHRAYGGGAYGLTSSRVAWFWDQYLADRAQRDNPLAAPLAADLRGLPPQLVIGAGQDCLLDDSLRLAERLSEAGVRRHLSVYEGVPHSFMQMSALLTPADEAITEAASAVRTTLSPEAGRRAA